MLNLEVSDAYILKAAIQAEVPDESVWQRQAPDRSQPVSAHVAPYLEPAQVLQWARRHCGGRRRRCCGSRGRVHVTENGACLRDFLFTASHSSRLSSSSRSLLHG